MYYFFKYKPNFATICTDVDVYVSADFEYFYNT